MSSALTNYRVEWDIVQKVPGDGKVSLRKYHGWEDTKASNKTKAKSLVLKRLKSVRGKYDTKHFPMIKMTKVTEVRK